MQAAFDQSIAPSSRESISLIKMRRGARVRLFATLLLHNFSVVPGPKNRYAIKCLLDGESPTVGLEPAAATSSPPPSKACAPERHEALRSSGEAGKKLLVTSAVLRATTKLI